MASVERKCDEKEKHSELHRMVGGETITEKLLIN